MKKSRPPQSVLRTAALVLRGRGFIASAVVCLFASSALSAEPDATLESLRAADRARETDATEAQAWAEEKARLELLITTIAEQTQSARQRTSEALAELRTLRNSQPTVESGRQILEDGAYQTAVKINDALDRLARTTPPGLVPPRGQRRADPRRALDEALHRLERTERAAATVSVSIAAGRLDGDPRSVEVVRFGGVAAWWRSLDGATGGEAAMVDGQLRLVENPEALDEIALASAIAKGRAAPVIVLLPVAQARWFTATSTQASR